MRFLIEHTCIHEACSVSLDVRDSYTAQHSNYSIFFHIQNLFFIEMLSYSCHVSTSNHVPGFIDEVFFSL